MDNDELTAYIVLHLTKGDDSDDIILDVCQKTGYSWPEAEEIVRLAQKENGGRITIKQLPLLTGIAFVTFVAGLLLIGYGLFSVVTTMTANKLDMGPPDVTSYILPVLLKGVDPASALRPAFYPYFNLIFGLLVSPISALIFGVAMVFGSLLGMRDVWLELLHR